MLNKIMLAIFIITLGVIFFAIPYYICNKYVPPKVTILTGKMCKIPYSIYGEENGKTQIQ